MTYKTIFNRLPGAEAAGNKKRLAEIMRRVQTDNDEYDFVPRSFVMPQDQELLQEFMSKNGKKTLICKPDSAAEGCGIILV